MEIKCKNLAIGYENKVLIENINFTIPKGSYTCIIGENGVGKSTLIKTLLDLLPPIAGEIVIGDEGVNSYSNIKLRRNPIGYLPQQTQLQKNFPASVYEVAISGCANSAIFKPFYNRADRKLANDNLEKLGVLDIARKSYSELSGGQQQRVLLARALCSTRDILLLDEPAAGLDAAATQDLYKVVKNLNREGITVVMITHNLQEVMNDIDYVISISKSAVVKMTKSEYEKIAACASRS